jgi:hypothetical protein
MKKTYLMAAIAALALVGTILLVTAGGDDAKQQTADTPTKTDTQAAVQQPSPATNPKTKDTTKPVVKSATQKKVATATTSDSNQIQVRRGPPSKRFYTSRVVDEPKIAPATEYRNWTTQQWASKVNTLRRQGNTDLAQQYVAAYEKTYPNKSLDPYLK